MKHIFLFTFCMAVLGGGGCRSSITVQDLQPEMRHQPKLPHLVPVMDVYPTTPQALFLSTVGTNDTFAGRHPVLLPPVPDSVESRRIRTTYVQDANANEMLVYFARDVEQNLSSNVGQVKGYISCRVNALETPQIGEGYKVLHSITFGTTLLTGIPALAARCNMEIEVVVRDAQYRPIKRYWGVSDVRKYSGIYYGYRWAQIQRATTLDAFKEALSRVYAQMASDREYLEKTLK
jgi:hypothetical protein